MACLFLICFCELDYTLSSMDILLKTAQPFVPFYHTIFRSSIFDAALDCPISLH